MEVSDNIIGKLTEKEYLEWKCAMLEYRLEDEKAKTKHVHQALMEKEIELAKVKLQMFIAVIQKQREIVASKKVDLDKFYDKIKSKKGIDLRNCAIDEHTLEIRDLT